MDKYICYVYYNEDWEPYYVGKGSRKRRVYTRHTVDIPAEEYIQIFYFEYEWEAFECEMELISFWKRKCDGGCLLNKTLGGPGTTGLKHKESSKVKIGKSGLGKKRSNQTRERMREARKNQVVDMEALRELAAKKARIKTTVKNIETSEVKSFESRTSCCRELNLDIGTLVKWGRTKGWELVS